MNSKQLVRHLIQYTTEQNQPAICNKTGIAIELMIPVTHGIYYEYPHPFSIYNNAIEFANLPYKTISSKYDINLVAGCFLTIFTEHRLLGDKLTAPHRNLLLQEVPSFILIDAMRFITSLNNREISWLPKLSLHDVVEQPLPQQPLVESIRHYINECKAIANPQSVKEKTATETDNNREYTIKILSAKLGANKPGKNAVSNKLIMKENKEEFKLLLKEVIADKLLSTKLINLLRSVAFESNLQSLHPEMRFKFTKVLEKTDNQVVKDLIKIINHSVYSKVQIEDEFERAISDATEFVPAQPVKVTIAMIMEAKRLGVPVSHLSNPIQQPIVEEISVIEVLSNLADRDEPSQDELEAITEDEDGLNQEVEDYNDSIDRTRDLVEMVADDMGEQE